LAARSDGGKLAVIGRCTLTEDWRNVRSGGPPWRETDAVVAQKPVGDGCIYWGRRLPADEWRHPASS
jgi:hypothetical protein